MHMHLHIHIHIHIQISISCIYVYNRLLHNPIPPKTTPPTSARHSGPMPTSGAFSHSFHSCGCFPFFASSVSLSSFSSTPPPPPLCIPEVNHNPGSSNTAEMRPQYNHDNTSGHSSRKCLELGCEDIERKPTAVVAVHQNTPCP